MTIIFNQELIALKKDLSTPIESIQYAGNLMVNAGICHASYIDAMCQVYHQFGSAIVLDDGLVMPHARPENGVLKTGFALVTLQQPLCFGHEEFDPVSVVIAIAGADANSHIQMIQLIANLIEADLVTFLANETERQAVFRFIRNKMEASLC